MTIIELVLEHKWCTQVPITITTFIDYLISLIFNLLSTYLIVSLFENLNLKHLIQYTLVCKIVVEIVSVIININKYYVIVD